MHTILGAEAGNANQANGRFYDTVIPHAVEPQPYRDTHDGYLAYVGRLEQRKGMDVVGEIAKHTGRRVLIAGQGPYPVPEGCEYVGVVNPAGRAALMGGAAALLCPTTYVEPFGLVAVEAMRCGTPVISTNWGGFVDTVAPAVSGYRCHTLHDFMQAVDKCADIDRSRVAQWAERFDPSAIAPMYYHWLRAVESVVLGAGWYAGYAGPVTGGGASSLISPG
jgi:glycosyltransferase involved in cell wall biosynthesis